MTKLIEIATNEIGVVEEPINKVKYNDWIYQKPTSGKSYAWVSSANTVTVRFHNASGGAIDPTSATFKVTVFKQ